jgi:hypothetical protein
MVKGGTDEINTIFEANEGKPAANAAEVKSLSADISLGSELESSKSELNETAVLPEKTFFFSDFPRQVYCTLSGIRVRLIQTGEGRGIAYLTFTQSCGSRRSDVASGPDWLFNSTLYGGPQGDDPRHLSWCLEPRLREPSCRAPRRLQLGYGRDQPRHQCAAGESQLAVPATGAQLRLSI